MLAPASAGCERLSAWAQVVGVTVAFLGLWLQLLGDSIRLARGCPDCRKGAKCAACLAAAEAIRPK